MPFHHCQDDYVCVRHISKGVIPDPSPEGFAPQGRTLHTPLGGGVMFVMKCPHRRRRCVVVVVGGRGDSNTLHFYVQIKGVCSLYDVCVCVCVCVCVYDFTLYACDRNSTNRKEKT